MLNIIVLTWQTSPAWQKPSGLLERGSQLHPRGRHSRQIIQAFVGFIGFMDNYFRTDLIQGPSAGKYIMFKCMFSE